MQTETKENETITPAADLAAFKRKIENYKGVLKKNKLIRDKLIQDNDEISAGVLMLAEIAGISVPADLKARDIISELAVILEKSCEPKTDLTGVQDLTKPSLSALLAKDNLLNMTKNCINISETVDETVEGGGDIIEANGNLWDFITDLAAAVGIELPEYEP